MLEKIQAPHKKLHESAKEIEMLINRNDLDGALKVFRNKTYPALAKVKAILMEVINAEKSLGRKLITRPRNYINRRPNPAY
jgi:hypothetical protein